jgi:hypothetical protein
MRGTIPIVGLVTATAMVGGGFVTAGLVPAIDLAGLSAALARSSAWLAGAAADVFSRGFQRSPAITLAIASLAAVPALAIAAVVARKLRERCNRKATDNARPDAGEMAARRIRLEGEITHIGRDAENHLAVSGDGIEAIHAVIRRTLDADFMIFDVSGRNGGGLLVNGRPLSSARLAHGDRIVLGATALVFHRFQGPVPA